MSDLNRNNPHGDPLEDLGKNRRERNPWQRPEAFASSGEPGGEGFPQEEARQDFSAWRRPSGPQGPSLFSQEPAPYGPEMLQGGVPLYAATPPSLGEEDFARQGGDAPTRIGRPALSPQMVSKRKTVERSDRPSFSPPFPPAERAPDQETSSPVSPLRTPEAAALAPPRRAASQEEPGAAGDAARSHRAGRRAARYQQPGEAPGLAAPPSSDAPAPWALGDAAGPPAFAGPRQPLPPARPLDNAFDSFHEEEFQGEEEAVKSSRRPAVPGERYTGARTAMPISGAPVLRSQVGALPKEQEGPGSLGDKARQARDRVMTESAAEPSPYRTPTPRQRPPRPQGPQDGPARQSIPRPQGAGPQPPLGPSSTARPQRPPERRLPLQEDDRTRRPVGGNEGEGAAMVRRQGPPPGARAPLPFGGEGQRQPPIPPKENLRGRTPASVQRPRYDFEEDEEIDVPRRGRRGCLVPVVALLLVLGIALAGIWLPDWQAVGGPVGGALAGAKSGLQTFGQTVMGLISPQKPQITGFTVTPTEGNAPATLVFSVQTSSNVKDLRFVDERGNVLLEKTLVDQDLLDGTVTNNRNGMIWSLPHPVEEAYSGLVTVQTLLPSGQWDEGMALASPLRISGPVQVLPLVSDFQSDVSEGPVPVIIHFAAQTSDEVVAVRVVDDYGTAVVSHSLEDGVTQSGSVAEAPQGLTWSLSLPVDRAYEGDYTLQYQTVDDLNFAQSDRSVYVELSEPLSPDEAADADLPEGEDALAAMASALLTEAGEDGGEETGDGDPELQEESPPQEEEALPPEQPELPATPAPTPAPTPLPALTAQADESANPTAITLKKTIYNELKTIESYSRTKAISMLDPFNYAVWKQSGVLTFRGGPFRQNAAYGTVNVSQDTLTQLWSVPVGSKKLSKSTVYGVAWPGQPLIVKWPTEVRNLMNLHEEKKSTTALKEVIVGGQDGMVYFLDLTDGQETRKPIDIGGPSGGGASIATNGTPILGIGQSHSNLAGKQVPNGYHLYNLISGKELLLLDGRDKAANTNYSGASGAALFDKQTQTMVVGGQNGVLYTVELNETFDHLAGSLKIAPVIQRYKTLAAKQDKKRANIDGSVAMYGSYVFYGDEEGVLQCVDINTLTPVWAVKTGDDINATPALDFEGTGKLALYTGNTLLNQRKGGVCTIRRYNALTGAQEWAYDVPDLTYTTEFKIGCMASPMVGENAIQDLVIFTVTDGSHGSQVIALQKASGIVAWTQKLESESQSSPVAVYGDGGEAWLIQAEHNGKVHLMNAETGEIVNTLQLTGEIEASPAVYRDIVVIGTTGKDTGAIYGIRIQ